ncbi:apolipoprotein N-acyltransferase [Sphingobium sp. CR28]|uniref:apolipoprotein N-acyltransferase n=1 Tax=Sphingobium sp. CR28 TaxID=3400272 RepID=UPI003FEF2AEF
MLRRDHGDDQQPMRKAGQRLWAAATARPALTLLIVGGVSATGFAPLRFWPLTLIAYALLLALTAKANTRRDAAIRGYAFGYGQFVVGLNWIAHAFSYQDSMPHWFGYGAVLLLSVYLAIFPAVAVLLAWTLGRSRPTALILALAGSWALTEYLRSSLFTGFAWNPLGVIWVGTGIDHVARLVGTYGLGMAAVTAAGAVWLFAMGERRPAIALAIKLAVVAGIGWMHGATLRGEEGQSVAIRVVQPNINQNEKQDPQLEWENFQRLAALTGAPTGSARLVFWPEAAVPAILDMEPVWRARLATVLGPDDLLLLGGDKYYFGPDPENPHAGQRLRGANNSVWVLDAAGALRGRYDKAHLVPYGEYLPMRSLLSAIGLSRLVPGDVDFWPGPGPRTLDLPAAPGRPALNMGVQICYEIIFSGQVIDRAHRPDFLFNPSNDAWFGSWGPPEHLAQARLRAIEEGIPIIRSTPTGISAVIDADGALRGSVAHHEAGAITAILPAARAPTLFARTGNILPIALALGSLLLAIAIVRGSGYGKRT